MDHHRFSEKHESLLGTNTAALDHQEVVSDDTVVWEASHWSDVLFGEIGLSGGVIFSSSSLALSDSVDLFVHFGSVEVTFLTGSGDSPSDSGWMPGTDTSDLSVTSVGFLLQMSDTPSLDDASESFTLGNTDNIDQLVFTEDLIDSNFLFKEAVGEVNLVTDGFSTVDLDFEDVVLLLSEVVQKVHLGVCNGSYDGAVLLDSVELNFDSFGVLAVLSLISGEGLLVLRSHPVLVESSESSLVQMVSPDSAQSSEASGSVNVADQTDNFEWGSFQNGDCLNFLLFIELSFGSVDISEDVGHAGLESSKGSEVAWLRSIILGECSYSSSVVLCSLSGVESEVSLSGA